MRWLEVSLGSKSQAVQPAIVTVLSLLGKHSRIRRWFGMRWHNADPDPLATLFALQDPTTAPYGLTREHEECWRLINKS